MSHLLPALLHAFALLALSTPLALTQPAVVTLRAVRDPVDKSYRNMVAGMDSFERHHALAPAATLRFQLLPRSARSLDGVSLRLAGDHLSQPVAIAADHSFTLERNRAAWDDDAALLSNRRSGTLTWRALVRSPGLPPGTRRLGDLRLECRAGVAAGLVSNNSAWFGWLDDWLQDPEQVCTAADGNYLLFAERPLFAVTLTYGTRRASLPFALLYAGGTQTAATLPWCDCQQLLDRSYYAPLWDTSWPDDTLLSYTYMDQPSQAAGGGLAAGYRSQPELRAALGPAEVIRFASGYQVWRYSYPAAAPHAAQPAELLVLFGPDGLARQSRRREPE
ncbi:MAG: hypothetical protein ACEQSK_00825 [Sphingomonadaceae bacterium]